MNKKIIICVIDTEIWLPVYREYFKKPDYDLRVIEGCSIAGIGERLSEINKKSLEEVNILLLGVEKVTKEVVEELRKVSARNPGMGIVVMAEACSGQDIPLLRKILSGKTGGMAIALKRGLDSSGQLYGLVRAVREGKILIEPCMATLLFGKETEPSFIKRLSTREIQITQLLSRGHSNNEIAGILGIESKTVEHHVTRIYRMLDAYFVEKGGKPGSFHYRVMASRVYLEEIGALILDLENASEVMS